MSDIQVDIKKLRSIQLTIGCTYLGCLSIFKEVIIRRCQIRNTNDCVIKGEDPQVRIPSYQSNIARDSYFSATV